jgi:hypothetical protein
MLAKSLHIPFALDRTSSVRVNMHAKSLVPVLLILALSLTGMALAQRTGTAGEAWDRDDVVTVEGRITDLGRPFATLVAGGTTYRLHLGPQWYWDREGYTLATGDTVEATGQVSTEGDTIHLYLHSMERNGRTYRFADTDGVPLWSHGRGSGYGMGRCGHGWHHHGPCAGPPCGGAGDGSCCGACPCRGGASGS